MAPPLGGLNGAKAGVKAFVDAMDGNCDETTLVSFNSQVSADVFITNDKVLLDQGIDALQTGGATSIWDAVVTAANEVANNGTQDGCMRGTCGALFDV